jgi:hypothetical protein
LAEPRCCDIGGLAVQVISFGRLQRKLEAKYANKAGTVGARGKNHDVSFHHLSSGGADSLDPVASHENLGHFYSCPEYHSQTMGSICQVAHKAIGTYGGRRGVEYSPGDAAVQGGFSLTQGASMQYFRLVAERTKPASFLDGSIEARGG